MDNPRCVTAKYEVKDIFDKDLKPVVLKQMKETVQKQVNIYRGLEYIDIGFCKNGWNLTVTLLFLRVNDKDSPPSLEGNISIVGVALFPGGKDFKQNVNPKHSGSDAKKMEQEVKSQINDSLVLLMKTVVIPKMLKPVIREEF